MRLSIRIDAPDEGEPPSPFPADTIKKLERVFEEEAPHLRKELEHYSEAEVSVSFLSMSEMKDLNKQYRGLDEPTDVLTFPLWEEEEESALPASFGMLTLGDIVICPEETEREHVTMTRRSALCLVLAHGFLHLLGWDHDTPEKEEVMWERQELLKSKLLNAAEEVF
jgi:probable rRNA maturation factor